MGEGKTNMFGKTYNTIGSTDSNFIIKTKGDLKVQWGGKFIDIIKNGKLASESSIILKQVSSLEDIYSNGIYLIQDEVWISIDGTKVNLSRSGETMYVSFLGEQKEITADQKYTALTNIGFYYESLKDAQAAGITAGIIFVIGENKLYFAKDGQIQEFRLEQEIGNELIVGDLYIYKQDGKMVLKSNGLSIYLEKEKVIDISDTVDIYKTVNIDKGSSLQSQGSSVSNGYRLYIDQYSNKSILEVDEVIERNREVDEQSIIKFPIVYENNNNVISGKISGTTLTGTLRYYGNYSSGMYVYLFMDNIQFEATVSNYLEEESQRIVISIGKTATQEVQVKITYLSNGETLTKFVTIYPGNQEEEIILPNSEDFSIIGHEVIQDFTSQQLVECKILSIQDKTIQLEIPSEYNSLFGSSISNILMCRSDSKMIQIDGSNLVLLNRVNLDNTVHSKIGEINEEELVSSSKQTEVGIYSDNFVGINSRLYDPIFKVKEDFPKYDKNIEIPQDFDESEYDTVVPNIKWIKQMLQLIIPRGTITMFDGTSEIPKGWAICDGTNGTPNLVGKFIKAVSSFDKVGENESQLTENNEFTITQEFLPKHSHPHKQHSHNISGTLSGTVGNSGDLTVSLDYSNYNWGIESVQKTFVTSVTGEGVTSETGTVDSVSNIKTQGGNATGGSHTHSISLDAEGGVSLSSATSEEETLEDSEWPNKPIKIEPRSYSLVFIMKL